MGRQPSPIILNTVSRIDTVLVQFFITESQYLMLMRTHIIEREEKRAAKDQKAELELILSDGSVYPHKGMADFVNREVDPQTGALLIQASFPNPDELLRPGQFAKVKAEIDVVKDGILIPQRCVMELQGTFSVYVLEAEKQSTDQGGEGGAEDWIFLVDSRRLKTRRKGGLRRIAESQERNRCHGDGGRRASQGRRTEIMADQSKQADQAAKGNFFVRRPIVAMVIAVITVIAGVVFLKALPIEQYPNITPPIVEVRATYTGADAISVEQSVATPLEQQINGVDNMIYMKSTNANDGTMTIQTSFDIGTDPDMNTVFTQNRVAAATAKLPEEVKRFGVTTEKSLPNILMLIAVTSTDGRYNQHWLGNYALINIKDILARIKGIGRVNVIGASDYSMRIWIKPDRLAQMGITVPEIMDALRAQSVIVPGGKFGAEPAPPGTEFTYTVRLPERLQSEKQFGEVVIRTTDDGAQVKIKHVARVELGVETYNAFTRLNDSSCAMIGVYQAPGVQRRGSGPKSQGDHGGAFRILSGESPL